MCNPAQCRYLAQASHLVATCELDGRLRSVDPTAAAALGHRAADLAGRPLSDLVAAEEHPHLQRILERSEAEPAFWDELALRAADGRNVRMLCCFQRLAGADRRGGIVVTGVRQDAFEAARQAYTAAVLGQLAFRCHRPAHRLMMALEAVLAQDPSSDPARRCCTELDALLEILSQAVSAPPAAGPGAPGGQAVDAVGVLEAALRLADGDAELGGMKVALRSEHARVWTTAHPVGLVFLALHLIRNAREATAATRSPRLRIDAYRHEGQIVLEFADNGSGLPREDLGSVFSLFFKKNGNEAHTGLGLATCSELVRYMGGSIHMQSRPAKGTTVIVTLPPAAPPR